MEAYNKYKSIDIYKEITNNGRKWIIEMMQDCSDIENNIINEYPISSIKDSQSNYEIISSIKENTRKQIDIFNKNQTISENMSLSYLQSMIKYYTNNNNKNNNNEKENENNENIIT
ncbi:hypothetical protein U3516DRAFT_749592 [Neocallimastix sp. 'constans']